MAITLPPSRILGDSGHVTDHATIRTALSDLDTAVAAKAPSANPTFTGTVTLTGTTIVGLGQGLTLINKTDFSASSAVILNSVFTAINQNYLVVVDIDSASTTLTLQLRLRASGVDNNSANYYGASWNVQSGGASAAYTADAAATYCRLLDLAASPVSAPGAIALHMFSPQAAKRTQWTWDAVTSTASLMSAVQGAGGLTVATQYDGLDILASTGNVTGTIRTYGLLNS